MSAAHESSTTQLFVDDAVIARQEGVVRRTHACRKLSQPVISDLESWQAPSDDKRVYIYGTVLPAETGDGLRMWYMRYPDQVLYAESEEGVIWRRPELGLVKHADGAHNNALPIRFHSPSVICDPTDPDPEHRYKMLGVSRAAESRGYCTAHSADGLNWRLYDANPVLTGGDTCCLARDPATGDLPRLPQALWHSPGPPPPPGLSGIQPRYADLVRAHFGYGPGRDRRRAN